MLRWIRGRAEQEHPNEDDEDDAVLVLFLGKHLLMVWWAEREADQVPETKEGFQLSAGCCRNCPWTDFAS